MTNTQALRDAVDSAGLKYSHIANCLGISRYGLQRKIENFSEFKPTEISALVELLSLTNAAMMEIFFEARGDYQSRRVAATQKAPSEDGADDGR